MDKHSLRRFSNITFNQLSAADIKNLINVWIDNDRPQLVRSELAEILKQLAGLTGGSDGVVESGSYTSGTLTLVKSIGSPVNISLAELSNKIVTAVAFTEPTADTRRLTVTFADATTLTADFNIDSGINLSTYDLLAGTLKVNGTSGITAAYASGVYTLNIPSGGHLSSFLLDVVVGNAVYTNGVVSNAVKIKINNSLNNSVSNGTNAALSFTPQFLARTSAGTVNAGNPLQWNAAINTAIVSDEWSAGVTSWVFPNIPANASAGGIITA